MSDPWLPSTFFRLRLRHLLLLPAVAAAYAYILQAYHTNPMAYFHRDVNAPFIAAIDLIHYSALAVSAVVLWAWATGRLRQIEAGHLLVLREAAIFGSLRATYWTSWDGGTAACTKAFSAMILIAYVIADHRRRQGPVWWPTLICLVGTIDLVRFCVYDVAYPFKRGFYFWGWVEQRDLVLPPFVESCENDLRQAFWVWASLGLVVVAVASDRLARIDRGSLHWCGVMLFSFGWIVYLLWRFASVASDAISFGGIDLAYCWWF